jgi:hypothetical protein
MFMQEKIICNYALFSIPQKPAVSGDRDKVQNRRSLEIATKCKSLSWLQADD